MWNKPVRNVEDKVLNCVVCVLEITIKTSFILVPINGFCRHRARNYSEVQHFRIAKLKLIAAYGVLFCTILATCAYPYMLMNVCEKDEKITCLVLWTELIFSGTGIILFALSLLQVKSRLFDLNGWAKIVENRRSFGINNVICVDCNRHLYKRSKLFFYLILLLNLAFISSYYFTDDALPFTIARDSSLVISSFIQAQIVFQFSQKTRYFRVIHKSLRKAIVSKLNGKLDRLQRSPNSIYLNDNSLEDMLKGYTRYILAMHENFKLLNDFLSPMMIIWLLASVANLIVNFYLIIIVWRVLYVSHVFILQVRTYTIVLGIIYLLNCVQKQGKVSSFYLLIRKYGGRNHVIF